MRETLRSDAQTRMAERSLVAVAYSPRQSGTILSADMGEFHAEDPTLGTAACCIIPAAATEHFDSVGDSVQALGPDGRRFR